MLSRKKVLIVNWFRAPSKLVKFIKQNNIKKKDILSLGRNKNGELELFYYAVAKNIKDVI